MEKDFVGIDVSKDTLDVATYPSKKKWQFPNSDVGLSELTKVLKRLALLS